MTVVKLSLLTVSVVSILVAEVRAQDVREVPTSEGPVRGYRSSDGEYFAFYGVPYATTPTGADRYKAPLPAVMRNSVFEAVDRNIACPQPSDPMMARNFTVREDCLIANIYVPDTEETDLPVVVYIHGGAYYVGFAEMLSPTHLVKTKRIIAVTFNYRLGVNGFLCLGTESAPGNAGSKDQVALLRWVSDNIAYFGGDSSKVTLAGCSAGGSSVDLLLLSKMTDGYFNKVIPESGGNAAAWSAQQRPIEFAKEFAKEFNFTDVDDFEALEKFYTTTPLEVLTSVSMSGKPDTTLLFSPCVEADLGQERFLDDYPVNILTTRNYKMLPALYGFTTLEGVVQVGSFNEWSSKMNEKFSDFLPGDLEFENEQEKEEVAKRVKEFYFGDKEINEETRFEYIRYYTDTSFAYPMLRAVKLHGGSNIPIYLYEYAFTYGDENPMSLMGAYHCAQSDIVLDNMSDPSEANLSEDVRLMKNIMREYWLNFMLTGNPVVEGSSLPAWPVTNGSRTPYMELDSTPVLKENLMQESTQLWDEIYDAHYRPPSPPSGGHSCQPFHIFVVTLAFVLCYRF